MARTPAAAILLISVVLCTSQPSLAQTPRVLELRFDANGLVTLSAQNVTVRDVMAEWARQCGCFVANADRLAGSPLPVPVSFVAATQSDVLRSLLRDAGGYALTPRRAGSTSVSLYETIYIIHPTGPVTSATAPTPALTPFSFRTAPDDEIPPVVPIVVGAESPVAGATPGEPPGSSMQPARPATPPVGFVITPVSPASPASPAPAAPGTPTTPGQTSQPGRVTPAPQP